MFTVHFGKITDSKKLQKQINNLKAVVKKKTDTSATGNKVMKLSTAEKIFFEAMAGDYDEEPNPVLRKLLGKIDVRHYSIDSELLESEASCFSTTFNKKVPPLPLKPKRQKLFDKYETEETKKLSNTELQKLVLIVLH
ncbi:hypothetical protein FQR65_LT07530 [Abscondita terminalis]|nr:hypothetical protein FQR65_LT07530 [Abscondita terminalis]